MVYLFSNRVRCMIHPSIYNMTRMTLMQHIVKTVKTFKRCTTNIHIMTEIKLELHKSLDSVLEVLNHPEHKGTDAVARLLTIYHDVRDEEMVKQIGGERKYPLIVLEGLDACGKTTATKRLANKLGVQPLVTPPACMRELRPLFDEHKELKKLYYALGNYVAAMQMATTLQEKPVVLDRFWHSTASFGLAQGIHDYPHKYALPDAGDDFYEWPTDLLKPDIVIFFNLSEQKRWHRIKNRTCITAQEQLLKTDDKFRSNVLTLYSRMRNPSLTNINANGTKFQVEQQIMEHVKPLLPADYQPF